MLHKEGAAAMTLRDLLVIRWQPSRTKVWVILPNRWQIFFKNSSEIRPEMGERSVKIKFKRQKK
jgi:hypothetical protein